MALPAQRNEVPAPATWELEAKFFRGLADPVRARILELLLDGERHVSQLVQALGMGQSRISMHLMCLRWCGLVTTRREGRYVYYQISDPRVRDLLLLARSIIAENAARILACQLTPD